MDFEKEASKSTFFETRNGGIRRLYGRGDTPAIKASLRRVSFQQGDDGHLQPVQPAECF